MIHSLNLKAALMHDKLLQTMIRCTSRAEDLKRCFPSHDFYFKNAFLKSLLHYCTRITPWGLMNHVNIKRLKWYVFSSLLKGKIIQDITDSGCVMGATDCTWVPPTGCAHACFLTAFVVLPASSFSISGGFSVTQPSGHVSHTLCVKQNRPLSG